jgi:cell division protein FtsI (penicillin-binding protein 3)
MAKRRNSQKQNSGQTIFSRFMLIVAFFALWTGVIGVRLVYLQVNQHRTLLGKARDQRRDETKSKTLRGTIFDRSQRKLALSLAVKTLYADPRYIDDVTGVSQRIAGALKEKPQEIYTQILEAKQKGRTNLILARKIDQKVADQVKEQLKDLEIKKADGKKYKVLYWEEEQRRSYPYDSLAAQVIGFSDLDDKGIAGVELAQDRNLRGEETKEWKDHDRLGRVYEQSDEEKVEPPKDVVLTLGYSIQYKVEESLKEGVEAARAKSGVAIVLDSKTGEILAMANYPTFDLNKFGDANANLYSNRAIQNTYEPGSVFKLVTYSSAIEEKEISPSQMFDCNKGEIIVAGKPYPDKHCLSQLSFMDAFAISSNIGAIKAGTKLSKEKFYNYTRQFGFGQATGVELPAESNGILRPTEKWSAGSLASLSIGYEIGVTALQSASAFATIANDGVRIKPHIIKEIRQGETVVSTPEVEKSQVVSPETAKNLRSMMQKVVLSGTGKRAQLNGYSCAGKTGTAWKYDPKLKKSNENKYISSFIGFASMDNPSIVIAVVLDEPQVALRDGGHVAAPIFRDIAEKILPELNVAPDSTIHQEMTADNSVDIVEGKEFKPTVNEKTVEKKSVEKFEREKEETSSSPKVTKDGSNENKTAPKQKTVSDNPKPKNKSSGKEKT